MYLGSWKIDDTVTFAVNTHLTTGVVTDADVAPTYRIYEDETGVPILTGVMSKLDDAGTVGFYSEQVQLLAATGFEKGKSYNILISATVGGVTGNTTRSLQIQAAVDAVAISGDEGAADSLETMLDGTGGSTLTLEHLNVLSESGAAAVVFFSGDNNALRILGQNPAVLIQGDDLGLQIQGGNTGGMKIDAPAVNGAVQISGQGGSAVSMSSVDSAVIKTVPTNTTHLSVGLVDEIAAAIGGGGNDPLAGVIEEANGAIPAVTLKDAIQFILSFMFGLSSGGGTSTIIMRDVNNARNCVVMEVDSVCNRLSVTRTPAP